MKATGWKAIELGPHCSKIGSGSTPRGGDAVYQQEGVSFIRSQNVYNGQFTSNGLAYLNDEQAKKLRGVEVHQSDVLLNITGDSVARCCLVPESVLPARVNQHVAIIRPDPRSFDPRFLGYFLTSPQMQATMLSLAGSGGTRKALTKEMIQRFLVPNTPIPNQERIAGVLSVYDDLIENNWRRITLLEQAAGLLYEEWFVRFRFPGHEHVKLFNGLPEGWAEQHLEELCDEDDGIQTGPFGSQLHQSDYSDEGVPVVMPKDMISFRIVSDGIARIPEQIAERLSRHRMVEGDTVYGRRGDIGRRAYVSEREVGWLCGTGCLRLRPNSQKIDPRFLFDALGAPKTAGTIANRAKGATLPNLNSAIMRSVPVLVPSRSMQELYSAQIRPMKKQIEMLTAYNDKLGAARDLLLPRLMSGEVEV